MEELKIVTVNVGGNNKEINTENAKKWLNGCGADIIAVQELPLSFREEKDNSRARICTDYFKVNNKLGKAEVSTSVAEKIWSEILLDTKIEKSFRDGYWKEIDITFQEKKIRIINIHISPTYHLLLKLTLLTYLDKLNSNNIKHIILLGDFNAAKNEDTILNPKKNENSDAFLKAIEGFGFKEVRNDNWESPPYTHYNTRGGRMLDHIYVSKQMKEDFKIEVSLINDINYTYSKHKKSTAFTDHSALCATFTKKTKSE